MRDLDRLDKSALRPHRYIGYACNQVWIVERPDRHVQWVARCRDEPWRPSISGDTLKIINTKLGEADAEYQKLRNKLSRIVSTK